MIHQKRSVSSHQRQVLRQRAQRMRHAPTASEARLWSVLSRGQQGVVFRRQVVLQGYVIDFHACAAQLAVEVDGSSHRGRSRSDARRDRVLAAAGYRVLRVSDAEVMSDLAGVVARIRAALETAG